MESKQQSQKMEFTARLIEAKDPVEGQGKNGNTWRRQELIFETDNQFARKICVQVWGDDERRRSVIANENILVPQAMLTVAFDLESREYNGRWYTDVRAWRITLPATDASVQGGQPNFAAAPATAPAAAPAAAAPATNPTPMPAAPAFTPGQEGGDDLPF